jgi:hypothetical protein
VAYFTLAQRNMPVYRADMLGFTIGQAHTYIYMRVPKLSGKKCLLTMAQAKKPMP